ncbi:MAG: IclR family transcriptional regulator [Thermomicrobiales bacterium]
MATSGFQNEAGRDQISSGRRTLAVLETLASQPGGMTPKEISKSLGLHLSTCYRLLNTLQAASYVVRSPDGHFTLGRRVAYLNHRYEATVRPRAEILAFLHALQVATGETALLLRLEDTDVVTVAIVEGSLPDAHPGDYVGLAGPAYAFAAGRMLLAGLPAAQQERAIMRSQAAPVLPGIPPFSPQALRDDLVEIRKKGYAVDDGDGGAGVCCFAAPVRGPGETASAVAVVAPCPRLRKAESRILPVLLEVARAMSALGGLRAPDTGESTDGRVSAVAVGAAQAAIASAMSSVL